MSLQIPLPPGMTVDKEDSDSDPEVVAFNQQRRRERQEREAREEFMEKEAAERKAARLAEEAGRELFLQHVCNTVDQVRAHLSSAKGGRPEDFEQRLTVAAELREEAKAKFEASALDEAVLLWFCAVHCLDFTGNELSARAEPSDAQRVRNMVIPIFSNLAVALRRIGDLAAAQSAADLGLDVAQALPYKDSKPLRVKLRFHRALVRGELRDFAGARDDCRHVLQLDPDHDGAKCVLKNAQIALQREKGPKELRWKGPLTVALPSKAKAPQGSSWSAQWKIALLILLGPLLAAGAARAVGVL